MRRIICIGFIAFAIAALVACGDDKPEAPEVEVSDDITLGSVSTTAFTATVTGSFDGISIFDQALGKNGVLYCLKTDDVASIFKSWVDGNDDLECEMLTSKLQGGKINGVINGLYPETEYSYCLFSQSKDSKTRKISAISSFTTGTFNPEFKAFNDKYGYYVSVYVSFKKIEMNELDAKNCMFGLLVSAESGAEAGPGSTLTPFDGKYDEYSGVYSMIGYGTRPDGDYYCRLYVKYKTSDGKDAYKYGPETTFSTRKTEDIAIDMALPSGIRWAICDLGEYGVDALADDDDRWGWQYYRWGSLKMFRGYRNVAANKDQYEYWDSENQRYSYLGDDIKGTGYDAAHELLGGKWRMPTKADVQELIDNTDPVTWGVGHNSKYGSALQMSADSINSYGHRAALSFVMSIGGFWTSTFEDGYPVAFDVVADSYNEGRPATGHMEFVTGKGGEYARHIRPVWDPNM